MTFLNTIKAATRLLIIHPNYQQQKPLLANLLGAGQVVYVRFDGNNLTQDNLNEQIYDAYQKALVKEIEMIILDECDRAKGADFDDFLHDLLEHINPIPIVLLSRQIPNLIFEDMRLRSMTEIWPVNPRLMYPNYAAERETMVLEVFGFGQGSIRVNGMPIENWQDGLSRRLFFFLIDREYVHREEIFETFWPHLDMEGAANAFHTSKPTINNLLRIDITEFYGGYYSLNPCYDVKQYLSLVREGDFAQAVMADKLYHQANSLYRGEFLCPYDMPWIEQRREELQKKQVDILSGIAKQANSAGNDGAGLVYYGRAAKLAPKREDIAYELIRLYLKMEMPCEALNAYHRHAHEMIGMGFAPNEMIEGLAAEAHQQCPNL